jgi:alanyl-tRNA synthetase
MLSDLKALEKEVLRLKAKIASDSAQVGGDAVKSVNNTKVLIQKVAVDNPAALRDLADRLKEKIKSGIVVLGSVNGPKAFLIVAVTKDLTDRFHAGNVIKQIASMVGGRGGGRPDMAQAGGTQPENLDQALEKAFQIIESS